MAMEPLYRTLDLEEISDHYHIIKRLGYGTFGKVLLVQDKITGEPMAMKLVRKDRTKIKTFLKELSMSIALSINHGIITTFPIFINTIDYYIMTQELATCGTLHNLIEAHVGVPEETVKRCAIQLARALDFIHGRGLVHRDIKPDNVFLMDRECYNIKLGDFGLTQEIGTIVSSLSHIIPYLSPELCCLQNQEYLVLHPSVDSWAFGVLLYVSLTGCFPWNGAVEGDIKYQVFNYWQRRGHHNSPPVAWDKFTKDSLIMFRRFLTQDPSSRASVLSVLNYIRCPWKIVEISEEEEVTDDEDNDVIEVSEDTQQFEFVIIQDQEVSSTTFPKIDPDNPVLVVTSENTTLALGSEVEIS